MFQDALKDSWAYQELFKEAFERGRKEGLEQRLQEALLKARQQELRRLRQTLVDIVLERFPKIVRRVQKYINMIDDPDLLALLVVRISLTKRAKGVTKLLVSLNGDDEHH
jgi:flagellar biosynthesis/type III secretory pathway protein FliH